MSMKNISVIFTALALGGVFLLSQCTSPGNNKNASNGGKSSSSAGAAGCRVAYVDIDTFEANYEYLKAKRDEFNKRQQNMQSELERSAQQYQNNVEAFQRKAQGGNISQSEGEATQKQLMQMQQSLRLREQALTEQLLKEKDDFNQRLHDQLDSFLAEYNKEKGYDYILSYSKVGSQILLANKNYDITADVIKGMNERSKNLGDSTKKK
jgi:outer membrane protein